MALAALTGPGWWFPTIPSPASNLSLLGATTSGITIDAVGEKIALLGRIWINGKPAGTKTISAAGLGKIHFLTGTVVWGNGATAVDVGIQDVELTAGPVHRPNGTFDVKATLVPGVETVTSSAWHTFTMETGTKSIAHGDLIAVVFHMTAAAGGDLLRVMQANGMQDGLGGQPEGLQFVASWGTAWTPIVLIEFDDGTLATLDGTLPILALPGEGFADTTNPDERGLIFQIPRTIKADAIAMWISGNAGGNSDFDLKVYSDPLGTPSLMYSESIEGATIATVSPRYHVYTLPVGSEIQFTKDTDYAIMMKATGTANVGLGYLQFNAAAYRAFLSNGAQLRKGTRNNSTGAFAETTTLVPLIGFRISHDDDGAGGGGGTSGVIGGPNKRANMQ